MDRVEATGVGVSVVGHAAVLALLILGLAAVRRDMPPSSAIEVSFVDDVGLTSAAPQPTQTPPEQGMAPDIGPVEDAAPAAPAIAPPLPEERPVPPRPALKAAERNRPEPPRQQPTRALPRQTQAPARQAAPSPAGAGERTRRSRLGDDILKGIGDDPSPSRSNRPTASMTGDAAANIAQAIQRQIQPCADRQVYPGPGAERIVTPVRLRLNRDGSLAARPTVGRQRGLDDENRRYAERVADLAVRSFVECAPLRGLPGDLYDVAGGWSNFTMNYRLPG